MTPFWLQGVILTLPFFPSITLYPVLIISAGSWGWCVDLSPSEFALLVARVFFIVELSTFCSSFLLFSSLCLYLYLVLIHPTLLSSLSISQLNHFIPHSDSTALTEKNKGVEDVNGQDNV